MTLDQLITLLQRVRSEHPGSGSYITDVRLDLTDFGGDKMDCEITGLLEVVANDKPGEVAGWVTLAFERS